MAKPQDMNAVLPDQFNNVILILVCGLVLLWAIKAIRDFYTMIQIRNAFLLTDRMVMIEGMGSYLSYFEGCTEAHANALVSTRQTKPPVDIRSMYVPCVLNQATAGSVLKPSAGPIRLVGGKSLIAMNIDISVTVPATAYVLFGFRPAEFKKFVSSESRNAGSVKKFSYFQERIFKSQKINNQDYNIHLTALHMNECCNVDAMTKEFVPNSRNVLSFMAIPETTVCVILVPHSSSARPTPILLNSHTENKNDLESGLKSPSFDGSVGASKWKDTPLPNNVFETLPQGSPRVQKERKPVKSSFFGNTINSIRVFAREPTGGMPESHRANTADRFGSAFSRGSEPNSPNTGATTNTSSSSSSTGGNVDCNMCAGVFIFKVPLNVKQQKEPSTCWASEFLLLDDECRLFSSMEIFGLGTIGSPVAASSSSSRSPVDTVAMTPSSVEMTRQGSKTSLSIDSSEPDAPVESTSLIGDHAITAGGKFVEEECVVCLTDPKKVLLLPCRHLCLCANCLPLITKCPVCRANFDEYVQIGGGSEATAEE
jgi:hypothetical protein